MWCALHTAINSDVTVYCVVPTGTLTMGYPTLLDWDTVQHKLPWNIVILLGSGFAIAGRAEVTSELVNWCIGILVYWSYNVHCMHTTVCYFSTMASMCAKTCTNVLN